MSNDLIISHRCLKGRVWFLVGVSLVVVALVSGMQPPQLAAQLVQPQQPDRPDQIGQLTPVLRLRPEGTRAEIRQLRLSHDGSELFVAGGNKRIDVWTRGDGSFRRDHTKTLRTPLGPGPKGRIAAMDLSLNDQWMAVGGVGSLPSGDNADFRTDGILIPMSGVGRRMLSHIGTVHLLDRNAGTRRALTSHLGYVLSIDVVERSEDQPPLLVVLGNDETPMQCDAADGPNVSTTGRSIRVLDAQSGAVIRKWEVPKQGLSPHVIAWLQKPGDVQSLRVALNTANGKSGGIAWFDMQSDEAQTTTMPLALSLAKLPRGQFMHVIVPQSRSIQIIRPPPAKQLGSSTVPFSRLPETVQRFDVSDSLEPSDLTFTMASSLDDAPLLALTTRRLADKASGHTLRLWDINARRWLGAPIELGQQQNPVVAISPDGSTVAATADATLGLKVITIAKLRNGNAEAIQVIRPDFVRIRRATLSETEDGKQGLRLLLDQEGTNTPSRFDLIEGEWTPQPGQQWESPGRPIEFSAPSPQLRVQPKCRLNDVDLQLPEIQTNLPPVGVAIDVPELNRPIAAIGYTAYSGDGSVRLVLIDGSTGEVLRECSGHDQLVTSIEFSNDRRRLTTVSADGLVCVWGLDDLKDLIGQRGILRGVTFCHDGADLIVTQLADGIETPLKVGDRVRGIRSDDGTIETFTSVARFLRALSLRSVDAEVTLAINRGGVEQTLSVVLVQATDERKPLLLLILTRENQLGSPSWLAWSPHGPFDASDKAIQERAGWHFNDDSPEGAIRFAPLSEYRPRFFGRGLIDAVLREGRVPAVWPPPVKPTISGTVTGANQVEHFAEGRSFTLPEGYLQSMRFLIDDVPASSIESVRATTILGDAFDFEPLATDPSIWQAKCDFRMNPGTLTVIQLAVRGDSIVDGVYENVWQIKVPRQLPDAAKMLPKLDWVSHDVRNEITTPDQWDGDLSLSIIGRVDADSVDAAGRIYVEIAAEGKEPVQQPVKLSDTKDNLFKGTIQLPLGRHLVTLVAKKGDLESRSSTVSINRIDPPQVKQLQAKVNATGMASAIAMVRSPKVPTKSNVGVAVESVRFDHMPITIDPVANRPDHYRIRVDDIPLTDGVNRIAFELRDQNRASRGPVITQIKNANSKSPPRLLVQLQRTTAVNRDAIDFSIRATTDGDLDWIRVTADGQTIPTVAPRLASKDTSVLRAFVPLQYGQNRIVVTAVDKAGRSSQSIHDVSRIQPPIRLVFDSVINSKDQRFAIQTTGGQLGTDAATGTAEITVRGRIIKGDVSKQRLRSIRGWVNGFLQSVATLQSPSDDEDLLFSNNDVLPFELPLTLTSKDSVVRFDLPDLPESEDSVARIRIQCANPNNDQTLHLMAINTELNLRQRKRFEAEVLKAFQIKNGTAPAFANVITGGGIYPTLTGPVRSDGIKQLIQKCKLQTRGGNGRSDVVMLYFQGQEIRGKEGRFGLVTHDVRAELLKDPSMVCSDYLGRQFDQIRGAHVVFLDVEPHADSQPAPSAGDPRHPTLGVMRLANRQDNGKTNPKSSEETDNVKMLSQLQELLPEVERLIDLANQMRKNQPREQLVFQDTIPPDLSQLRIGGG
ncbi:MAG: WD40 repeat domain-containing protein [Planctomycetota bacterium]